MKKSKQVAQVIFYSIFKPLGWLYFVLFQHVRFKKNGWKVPKGPVLIISKHSSNWDGVWLNAMFFNRIIHFIVHDEMFKGKFLSFLSGTLLGEVKRGPNHQDIGPVMEMLRLKKEGKTIGIFPEGDIHMFGRTLPIEPSIAKMIKKLNIPVVCMRLTGAHLRATRVAKYPYHSHITYEIKEIIMPEEFEQMSVEDLHKRVIDDIYVDEMEWQRTARVKQHGFKRAEWLELGLFMCPKCHKIETLKSKGNKFYCTNCDFEAKLNKYSFFESNYPMPFDCTSLWDDWQLEELKKYLINYPDDTPIFIGENIDFYKTTIHDFFYKPYAKGEIRLFKDRLEYKENGTNISKTIYLKDITRAFLQYKDVLEIVINEDRYRFGRKKEKWSGYLWTRSINYLIEQNNLKD